jgi:WD40 repeat protein
MAQSAWAEETRTWVQTSEDDFAKGTARGLSIRNDGKLELAPLLEQIDETPTSYFWDIVAAPDGTIYAAAGPEASVIRIAPNGDRSVFFKTDAIEIHSLALDANGNLYAAAAPSAQIYRISPNGEASPFYDPHTPYVWDMAFGPDGALYLATGDRGEVHRIEPDGTGAVFFETGDVHVRSLAFDAEGRLVIGTDPSGLILRIDASGDQPRGFVLHQTARKEVTAIAVGADGTIYAAGVGVRSAAGVPSPAPQPSSGGDEQSNDGGDQSTSANEAAQAARPAPSAIALQVRGGSSVVRIASDGEPLNVWESSEAIAYSLGFDASGRLLIGTGDDGRLYRVDSTQDSRLLTTLDSNQITAIAAGPGGSVLLGASNIGKIFRLGPGLEAQGTFESDVLDAEIFSRWGALESEGEAAGGEIQLSLRSGNVNRPNKNWSDWIAAGGSVPAAEFAQFRATLRAGPGSVSPRLDAVTLYYRPVNRQPRIVGMEITPPNYRFPTLRPASRPNTLSLPPLGTPNRRTVQQAQLNQTLVEDPGWMAVRWQADDPNGDSLRAQIEIRGENDSNWVVLGQDIEESEFSWDSSALPDGRYSLRLTVSDTASNPAGESLSASRETELFLIDNTSPAISGLSASVGDARIQIRFQAQDAASKLTRAEYSINGGDWAPADPANGLFDAGSLVFDFEAAVPAEAGGIVAAVRVYDERDNAAAARTVVR